jgi:AcrR family transcriptional regulator
MPRSGLNRLRVIKVAAGIADREGLQALTIARLAAVLKVKPPSLYNHLTNLDALHDELARRGLQELLDHSWQAVAGLAARDALDAMAHAQRQYAQKHPGVYKAAQLRVSNQSAATRKVGEGYVKLALAVLRGYGLRGNAALHAVRAIRSAVRGFIEIELDGGFGLPLDLDVSFETLIGMIDSGLRARKGVPK